MPIYFWNKIEDQGLKKLDQAKFATTVLIGQGKSDIPTEKCDNVEEELNHCRYSLVNKSKKQHKGNYYILW